MALLLLKVVFRMTINSFNIGILSLSLLIGCNSRNASLPFYNTADFTAEWIEPNDAGYNAIHTIDSFALQNQLGHLITRDSLEGYIYVANFFFTTCMGICPKMISNFQLLQDRYANNNQLKLLSFSVMPRIDSIHRLKAYGENHQIDPAKWYLLTGNKERIYKLGRKSYFSEKRLGLQKDSSDFLHTESMLLIDKRGRIRGIYNATDKKDIERVMEDINILLKE